MFRGLITICFIMVVQEEEGVEPYVAVEVDIWSAKIVRRYT